MPKSSAETQRQAPPPGATRAPNRFRADYPIPTSSNGRKLIDPRECARRVGCHPLTLYRWMKTIPDFPHPIRMSPGRVAFFEDEITKYIDTRPRVT
jgi:predicted DNA-binding transcriptional regulator AlpA